MYWSWFRLGAAAVGLSGVVAGFIVNVDRATRQTQDLSLVLANYFSLFTIFSTMLSIVILTAAAAWARLHPGTTHEPITIALGMAMVTGPILLLGVVYNVLLRGGPSGAALGDSAGIAMMDSYAIESLHVVLPLYFLADLLFAPRRRGLSWSTLVVLAGYPLLWLLFTMVRGELVSDPSGATAWWYPYPFLDPHASGGWPSALMYIAVIFVAFVGIGAAIIATGRHRGRRAVGHVAAAKSLDALQR
jgi:hypothetical protein